jgi:hypothetical protein
MNDPTNSIGPKIHPATREVLPDDPMEMHASMVPGDTQLMLRMLVEEFGRIGWGLEGIMQMAKDPNYLSFHGMLLVLGEEELRCRVKEILSKCGVIRVKAEEVAPDPENLVQIEF